MPYAPPRPCRVARCPELVTDARPCPVHGPARRTYPSGRSVWKEYGGSFWLGLRRAVLAEEPLCRACLTVGRPTLAVDVDHIRPRRLGGSDERANLQALCRGCHTRKTMRERAAARRAAEEDLHGA
jgi:5-methylcytosine-specific restriction protein A